MMKRLVISYSSTDVETAYKMRDELCRSGYDVWIADTNLRGFVHGTQALLDAIDSHDGLVLLWSADAVRSPHVLEEVRIARAFRKPIFPVLAYPMARVPGLPDAIESLQVINAKEFDANLSDLKARLADTKSNSITYPPLAIKGYIPRDQNPYFVGRSRELKVLFVDSLGFHGNTKLGYPIAVSGFAGIGKTELALEFCYRFSLFFDDGVFWVNAPSGIVHEFGRIGPHLGVRRLRDEHPLDYAQRVREALSQRSKGLIVFDDVPDDISGFHDKWCPKGGASCSVIFTTRLAPRGFPVRVMSLHELDAESASELIIARREDRNIIGSDEVQRQALREICIIMGNHPMALELCASLLQSGFIRPTDFLADIQKDPLQVLGDRPESEVSFGAGRAPRDVLNRSYESLDRKLVDPYFLLMCCFGQHGIDQDMIVQAYEKPGDGRMALDRLADHSLIRREQPNRLFLHPVIALFGRDLEKETRVNYRSKFVDLIVGFLQSHRDNLAGEQVRKELPHIYEACKVSETDSLWDPCARLHEYCAEIQIGAQDKINHLTGAYQIIEKHLPEQARKLPGLRLRIGSAHRTRGALRDALTEFGKAEDLYRSLEDADPAERASVQFELGDTFLALGEYEKAETRLFSALNMARNEAGLDETSPEISRIRQALASRERILGNYDAAKAGLKAILDHREKFYANQPDAASAAGLADAHADLSRLALALGDYDEAVAAAEKAFAITREHHRESDPACSQLFLLLGTIHYESGNYKAAEHQVETAQQNFLSTFGDRHPSCAETLVVLGDVHRKLGQFALAQREIERATSIATDLYGGIHPLVAKVLEVRGKIYDHLCEFDEEQKVWEQLLDIQKRFYSEQHPALATTYHNYANLHVRKGEYAKAVEHLKKSLDITEKSLGRTHPDYFGRLVLLATCLYEQQQYAQAQAVLDETQELRTGMFGNTSHPYIARMFQLQSEVHRRLARFEQALRAIDEAIEMKKAIYGTEQHPSVAEALEVKVKVYHHLSERSDAKVLIERALQIRTEYYGENHPEVGRTVHDLGSYHLRLGEYAEAIKQFEKARTITASVFGKAHPDYIERTLHLANALNEQGQYRQALELIEEIEKALPSGNHYLTARWLQQMGELLRRLGHFKEAVDYIDRAVNMKIAVYGSQMHPSVAEALEVWGKIYDHLCQFDEEQRVWEQLLDIQKRFYSEQHPALATTHYNYANLYVRKGEYDKAVEHLNRSLDITEKSLGRTHPDYFGRLVLLATCLYEQQQYAQAQAVLDEAQELRTGTFGTTSHPYIARMLQLQSEVHRRLARFDQALRAINDAIEMKKAIYGTEQHPSVAEALEVKAVLALDRLQVEDSRQILETIKNIRHDAYGERHPEYANYQMRLAEWYSINNQYGEAQNVLEQSLQLCLEVYSAGHPAILRRQIMLATLARMSGDIVGAENHINKVYETLGHRLQMKDGLIVASAIQERSAIRRIQGDYRTSLAEVETAIEIETNILTNASPDVLELQIDRARLLILLYRLEEADAVIEDGLSYTEHSEPIYRRLKADLLEQLGKLQIYRRQYDQALDSIDKALQLKEEASSRASSTLARLHIAKAVVLRHQGKYNEALTSLETAHNIDNRLGFGENHVYFARIFLENGQTYLCRRNELYAREHLKEALEIYGVQPNRDIKEHADTCNALGMVYLESGALTDAAEQFKTALELRTKIFGDRHPEVAETLHNQAKVLVRMASAGSAESEDLRVAARQKLEQALQILQENNAGDAVLLSNVEHMLATL